MRAALRTLVLLGKPTSAYAVIGYRDGEVNERLPNGFTGSLQSQDERTEMPRREAANRDRDVPADHKIRATVDAISDPDPWGGAIHLGRPTKLMRDRLRKGGSGPNRADPGDMSTLPLKEAPPSRGLGQGPRGKRRSYA